MSIKKLSYENLQLFVGEIDSKYAKKSSLGTIAALNEIGEANLAADLKAIIEGKANAATTLAGYGITDGMTAAEIASAISSAIAGADHLQRTIVDSADDIDVNAENAEKYIYMVPKAESESGDTYDEYMIVNGVVERVGDWKVDLSDYAKTAEVTQAIAAALVDYAKTADVTSAINNAVAGLIKLDSLSTEVTGNGNVVTNVEYDKTTGKTTVTKGMTALQESDFEPYTEQEIKDLFV